MENRGSKLLNGSIWKGIVSFAIPLFLGNMFQQLYNTVDSLIVGNFLGSGSQLLGKPDLSSGRVF